MAATSVFYFCLLYLSKAAITEIIFIHYDLIRLIFLEKWCHFFYLQLNFPLFFPYFLNQKKKKPAQMI